MHTENNKRSNDFQVHPINYWGPYILYQNLDKSFSNKLLNEGKKLTQKNDWSKNLVGQLNKQLAYKIQPWITNGVVPYVNMWVDGWNHFSGMQFQANSASLEGVWINFQKPGDYNPEHTHGGADLSFVMYLRVPKSIREDYYKHTSSPKNRDSPPGAINFKYVEYNKFAVSGRHICPRENTIYMFPSYVRHQVAAFSGEGERISVAGNIIFL